jgi:predicted nucleotidyltransferase component of viral defense system
MVRENSAWAGDTYGHYSPFKRQRDTRFKGTGSWLYDTTGIELPAELLRFDVHDLKTGGRAGEGRLAYCWPIAPHGGDLPRVKLDLTADERVVLPPVIAPVTHPYTDAPAEGIAARYYAFEELFSEKVRALAQRARPRDLYDVINLFRHGDFRNAAMVIRNIVTEKWQF